MLQRRDLLKLTAGGLAAGIGSLAAASDQAGAQGQSSPDPWPFGFTTVLEVARAFAKRPFHPASTDLPAPFNNLGYDQYVAIRASQETMVWAGDNVGFAIEPLHRGFIFSAPMQIYLLDGGPPRQLTYSRSQFDFCALQVQQNLPHLGFAGFHVRQTRGGRAFAGPAIVGGASVVR